ncbi:type 4a pilus biogenesis protein PilO [Pseudomonas aegrilactucae]|uniref:Type II secretion system protein M n=1 Tax=Pseudomonas aegrilactucae TaxID=2854028 RepID=A0A9Q3AEV9_9PSED|nr:type 4a pilus biogenesis protein PilO [Pseudomonas aegrilactucae]MBV6289095.1 type II secretion system protein M [Pseudomonas aegrilactucae]
MHISSLIVHEHLQRLGWPLLAGTGLLLLALLYGASLVPQWQQVNALRDRHAQLAEQVRQLKRGERQVAVQAADPLQDLHRQLPAQPQATEVIERLYALARAEKITLARGEYALGVDPKTRLARYQILLPLRGSYPQIRRFLHALLGQMPALVLEDIDLQRKRIGDSELTGRIRMTLFLSRS